MDFECQAPAYDENEDEIAAASAAPPAIDLRDPQRASALEAAARQTLSRLGNGKTAATSSYKVSRYDIPVNLADGSALLFNSRTRSLILLSDSEARPARSAFTSVPMSTMPASHVSSTW